MVDSNTFTEAMLSNPNLITESVIRSMQNSGTSDNPISIDDPNNGFVMMLLAQSYLFSNFSKKIDNTLAYLYPTRSRSAAQLYPHLSKFDYVQLMAQPAVLPFMFVMGKQWIIDNSVDFSSNYKKLVIPSTSYFLMGGIQYSMYYPIEILVNKTTGSISAYYDTSVKDSLNTLNTNQLIDVQEYTQNGIDLFRIVFNMYQFSVKTETYVATPDEGFTKTIPYVDKFYVVKVYYINSDLSQTELEYSLSDMYYDYQAPTAVIDILSDVSQLKITIPKIYFDNNLITQNIVVKIYTTKGSVSYNVSAAEVQGLTAYFDPKSSSYAAPFDKSPTWSIIPTQSTVVGGSDPMSFKEIRKAFVSQGLYNRVAITNNELIEAGARYGFKITKVVDDLTERVFYAANTLKDANGIVIPVFAGSILLKGNSLLDDTSSIINHSDNYHTVLPTTLFKLPNDGTTVIPLTDAERTYIQNLTSTDRVEELNTGKYLRQPYHITLHTVSKSPKSNVYNLMTPEAKYLSFVSENSNSAPQMSALKVSISHQNHGTGGYLVSIFSQKSSNIADGDLSNYQFILICKDIYGDKSYLSCNYVGSSNGIDLWQAVISTSYHINLNNNITVIMNDDSGVSNFTDIKLEQPFSILSCFTSSFNTSVTPDTRLNSLLPTVLKDSLTVMSEQTVTMTLGKNLSSTIYSAVNTTWGNAVYQTAEEDVFFTTPSTIFLEDENGLVLRYNSTLDKIETIKVYDAGDVVSSELDISTVLSSVANPPSSGTTTRLYVNDTRGVLVGMPIRGLNISVGSKVIGVDSISVTIDSLITASIPAGSVITVTNQRLNRTVTANQSSAGATITINDNSNVIVGMSAFGFGITYGTTVAEILSSNRIRLSVPTTEAIQSNTKIVFINKTAKGTLKTAKGAIVTDSSNNPIVVEEASNQYRIPSILFDGRLFESTDPTDIDTINNVYPVIDNYIDQVVNIDAGLLEGNQLFYIPLRSMGYGDFGIGNGQKKTLRLELSFSVNVFVSQAVYNDIRLTDTMKKTIINIINSEIQNDIISISDITDVIKQTLDTNVIGVEMGGINGDDTLRLIFPLNTDVSPSVEYKLVINPDRTISREPNITIEFIPSSISK